MWLLYIKSRHKLSMIRSGHFSKEHQLSNARKEFFLPLSVNCVQYFNNQRDKMDLFTNNKMWFCVIWIWVPVRFERSVNWSWTFKSIFIRIVHILRTLISSIYQRLTIKHFNAGNTASSFCTCQNFEVVQYISWNIDTAPVLNLQIFAPVPFQPKSKFSTRCCRWNEHNESR